MNKLAREIVLYLGTKRRRDILEKISPLLKKSDNILDIGTGIGDVCNELIKIGHTITPVDVKNSSLFENIKPVIYSGERLPFEDKKFDVSLLLTVLHHIKDPVAALKEAARVSKRVIVMEDTYDNALQKYITFAMDSATNLEFFGHPHTNKTKSEWEKIFDELGLKILSEDVRNYCAFFTSATYHLERN